MNNLYVITGPAGVGKSTISNLVANSLEKSCMIEGDDIYHFVVGGYVPAWLDRNHLPLFWKNVKSVIKNCLEDGFDVVFNYILDKEDVQNLKQTFPNTNIKFVVLLVDEETIVKRDKLRPLDCQMGERSLLLLRSMLEENFDEKHILNSSKLTAEETAKIVIEENKFSID